MSLAVAGVWPRRPDGLESLYCTKAANAIHRRPGQLVADVGGGKALRYADYLVPGEAHIVAVDVSEEELVGNEQVAETRVADVSRHLPFADGEVDVLTSSSVLEHLPDLGGFLDEAARVVKPDGVMVHVFPSGYAPFAILNRVLPERVKRWALFRTYPESEGVCGFPAFYDKCHYSAFVRECERRGFRVESATAGYYGSSAYFSIFFPLFVTCRLWEWSASTLGARNLASQLVVEARRLPD
jgi:SAM-dependent methyltransferase